VSRKLPPGRSEELKSSVADLIEDYGLTYPLQPLELADALGAQVVWYNFGLPSVASALRTDDGFTEPVRTSYGHAFRMHVNGQRPAIRQRFTVAHECGHIWLDHLVGRSACTRDVMEVEANFFAGYLLAPDALIHQWVPSLTVDDIAATFEMSGEAATIAHRRHLNALNLNALGRPHDQRIASAATRSALTQATQLELPKEA
jgi:hypothetical protein